MLTKIFTTIPSQCPYGRGCMTDSTACRTCPDYWRTGTAMFFWCKAGGQAPAEPVKKKPGRKPKTGTIKTAPGTRKRGRPRKNAKISPNKGREKKK